MSTGQGTACKRSKPCTPYNQRILARAKRILARSEGWRRCQGELRPAFTEPFPSERLGRVSLLPQELQRKIFRMRHTTALHEVRHQLNACFIAACAFNEHSTQWVYQVGDVELAAELEYFHRHMPMNPSTCLWLVPWSHSVILQTVEVFRDDAGTINRAKW